MKHWFGIRYVSLLGDNPGNGVVQGPFDSYDEAKARKLNMKQKDTESTPVFTAINKNEAELNMLAECFNRL